MAENREVSEIEIRASDKASANLEKIAKAGRTLEGAILGVVSAEEKRELQARQAEKAFERLERRTNALASAAQRQAKELRTIERAAAQTGISEERLARQKQLSNEAFERAERVLKGNQTAYERLRNQIDGVTRAERDFANAQDIINKALERGEVSAAENGAELRRVQEALEDNRRAALNQVSAYQSLREQTNPLIRLEREYAAAVATVRDAVRGKRASFEEGRQVVQELRAELERSKAALDVSAAAFDNLQNSLFPTIAAERQLADATRIVNTFLAEHPERAAEAAAAQKQLQANFDKTVSEIENEKTAFQELNLRIDKTARAQLEFARDTAIVREALKKEEISAEEAARAMALLNRRLNEQTAASARTGRGIGNLRFAFAAATGVVAGFFGSFAVRELTKFNDIVQQSTNRLRIVSDSTGELVVNQERLFESSQRSYTSILAGVEVYERLARSTKSLDIANERLLVVTEAIQKSVALSGTTALAANSALIQFGQGLAADSLRGQELNSVMEQTPRLARALAEGLGIGIGELRELANQGELTAEKVITAIESQVDVIEREFATIDPTFQQVATAATNSATKVGAAFGKPIFDVVNRDLREFQELLDDPKTIEGAEKLGAAVAARISVTDALIARVGAIGVKLGDAIVGYEQYVSKIVAGNERVLQSGNLLQKSSALLLLAFTDLVPGTRRYYNEIARLTDEQEALNEANQRAKDEFLRQEQIEALGRAFGVSAENARELARALGLLPTSADEAFDASGAGQFNAALDEVGKTLDRMRREDATIVDDLTNSFLAAKVAAIAFAQDGIGGVIEAFRPFNQQSADFDAFIKQIEEQAADAKDKFEKKRASTGAGAREVAQERFSDVLADPAQAKRLDEAAAALDKYADAASGASKANKDAARSFQELALRARELSDLQALAEAAKFGPEALEAKQKEIDLQIELIELEADARESGEAFNRAAEEARLRELQTTRELIDANLEAYEKLRAQQDDLRDNIVDRFKDQASAVAQGARSDRGFESPSQFIRDQALQRQLQALQELQEVFDANKAGLDPERVAEEQKILEETRRDIYEAHRDGGDYIAEQIRNAAKDFSAEVIGDLIFNGGRGLRDIFRGELERSVTSAFIDPLSTFLSGDSPTGDIFKDIEAGIDGVAQKFGKVGDGLDKLLGTKFLGGAEGALAGAGAGFAGQGLGSGAADIFNGRQGETGGKVGGAVGGGIGFAVGGPVGAFVGSAIGGFLGDLFGGLFGRKSATGSVDFDTGEFFGGANSKKDSRNERRDIILENSLDAIKQLASILDADIKSRVALEVNAGKKSIQLDIIDPVTGRVIVPGGKVDDKDVAGAISRAIDVALSGVIEGGDARLTRIAKAFAAADIPAEKLLQSISDVADALSITKEPTSEFRDAIDSIADVFEDAIGLAQRYATATKDLADAQLDALNAVAGKFDESVADETRRLTSPIEQDAIDLAREQQERLKDATAINEALQAALAAVASATTGGARPTSGGPPRTGFVGFGAGRGELLGGAATERALNRLRAPQEAAATVAANDNTAAAATRAADAQERLNSVIALSTKEWEAFIKNAGGTPESFRAAALAIEKLRAEAAALGIDFSVLEAALADTRASLAAQFDAAQERRRLELTNPISAQAQDLVDAQVLIIQAAKDVSGSAEDQAARLQRVFANNAIEFAKFIENAGNTPDAILSVVEALELLETRATEIGLSLTQIQGLSASAVANAGDAFLEKISQDLLAFTNQPVASFKALLTQQQTLLTAAEKFAELNPARFAGLPNAVRNRNAAERQQFLEGLSDEDKLRLGDFIGLIEDYGGRIDVVTTQLRDALTKATDGITDRIRELDKTIDGSTQRAERIGEARVALTDQYFPGSRLDSLNALQARLQTVRADALAGNESAQEAIPQLVAQFLERSAAAFGTSTVDFSQRRDLGFEILDEVQAAALETAATARTEKQILEEDLEVSKNLLDSFNAAIDNTAYLKDIQAQGLVQNDLTRELIDQLVALRDAQSSQDLSVVTRLNSVGDAASPIFDVTPTASFVPTQEDLSNAITSTQADSVSSFVAVETSPSKTNATAISEDSRAVIGALGALETSFVKAVSDLSDEIAKVKEELQSLKTQNQKLNNELKAAISPNKVSVKAVAA